MDERDARERLARLSPSARRLVDYAAVLEDGARWAVLRHIARISEEDMVEDLQEATGAGILVTSADDPNRYVFADETVRAIVLAEIGEARLPRLRSRAEAARRRVEGG